MISIHHKRYAGCSFLVFLLFCTSCSPYVFPHPEPAKTAWDVTLQFDSTIAYETQKGITKEFETFISDSRTTSVRFVTVTDTAAADMMISIGSYSPVRKRDQVWGVASALLGVASAGLGFGFVSIPKSSSIAQVYVYDGDNNKHIRRKTQAVIGPGFLKTQRKQLIKHPKGYRKFFKSMLRWYESDLLNAKKKGTPIV